MKVKKTVPAAARERIRELTAKHEELLKAGEEPDAAEADELEALLRRYGVRREEM